MDMNVVVMICGLGRGAEGGFYFYLWKKAYSHRSAMRALIGLQFTYLNDRPTSR